MSPRLKREECLRTKHDSLFSKWKVLIGPSDWEDYSLGKDGVERYRIHNIPIHSACPGLYELGIASNPGGEDKRTRRHAAENVIVVYLGQADNVRTRLQQYGRAGAHLDHRNSSTSADKIEFPFTQNGPGLFKEIFSRGHSIMFRWVPMTSKIEAEKTEASLLEVFDYAWNRRGNGVCRREEVLSKLDKAATSPISSAYRKVQQWKQTVFDKKAGIKINGSMPLDEVGSSEGRKGFLPDVLKFVTSRPRLVQGGDGIPGDHDICGVGIGGGLVCRNKPVKGRERCEEHKGRRIAGIGKVTSGELTATSEKSSVCGFVSEGGSVCSELAIHGRKRCELHKGRRVLESHLHISSDSKLQSHMMLTKNLTSAYDVDQEYNICGVVYWDGSICRKKPVSGRKRCEHHKGQRIAGTRLLTSEDWMTKKECNLDEPYDICGVVIGDGYVCRRKPVIGRKRCEEHKGRRVASPGLMISMERELLLLILANLFSRGTGMMLGPRSSMAVDSCYCLSWRFAVEANNAQAWRMVPAQCVFYVENYMLAGQYNKDLDMVMEQISTYLNGIVAADDGMDAWVLDIDDTCLSNLWYYEGKRFGGDPWDPSTFKSWAQGGLCPAIPAVLRLYKRLKKGGFNVFLLTGRDEEALGAPTARNLHAQGFIGYERLILRGPSYRGQSAVAFKSAMRKQLVEEGYRIRGNVGDQWSDLQGDCNGDRIFKIPNPMYFVP